MFRIGAPEAFGASMSSAGDPRSIWRVLGRFGRFGRAVGRGIWAGSRTPANIYIYISVLPGWWKTKGTPKRQRGANSGEGMKTRPGEFGDKEWVSDFLVFEFLFAGQGMGMCFLFLFCFSG